MYLLFSNYKSIIKQTLISLILIVIQGYLPIISISNGLFITCDLFLIYLTIIALRKELYKVIIFAFFIGMFQDFVIQSGTMGLYAFLKVISVYFISYINRVQNLWSISYKILYLFFIYFLHYFLYHFVFINELSIHLLIYIIIETIVNIVLFIICDKIFFNN